MTYKTNGVCAKSIDFEIDGENKVRNVTFEGGCSGNTQGVARLVEGMDVNEAISRLEGIRCGWKTYFLPRSAGTSFKRSNFLKNERRIDSMSWKKRELLYQSF